MKLSKRGIVALALAVLMVLTSVPAFAAVITAEPTVSIPDEGMEITTGGLGWTGNLRIVLSDASAKALGVSGKTASNYLKGTLFSGVLTYKNYDESKTFLQTITFEDAVVTSSVKNGAGTKYCLELSMQSMREGSRELMEKYESDTSFNTATYFNKDDCDGYTVTNGLLKKGTCAAANGETLDTKVFPEGTIFVSMYTGMNEPGVWITNNADGYNFYVHLMAGNKEDPNGTDGPFALFKAKESGNYKVLALRKELNDTNSSRKSVISINGTTKLSFAKDNATSTFSWFWGKPTTGTDTVVSLKAGQDVCVRLDGATASYGRLAAIAFVPAEANLTFTDEEAHSADLLFSEAMISSLQNVTTDKASAEAGASVNVTVNGTAVTAAAWAAKKAGATVPMNDLSGAFLKNATVLDALQSAGVDTKSYAMGYVGGYIVKLNGKVVNNYAYMYVNEGDAITYEVVETADKTNFSPINIGNIRATDGSTGSHVKYCVSPASLPDFAKTTDDGTGMTGCYVNGYLYLVQDMGNEETGIVPAGSMAYFKNVKVLKTMRADSTRVDWELDYIIAGGTNTTQKVANVLFTLPDGTTIHDPFKYMMQVNASGNHSSPYDFTNLYMTNSKTEAGIKVVDNGDHYVVIADGFEHIYLVTVTKDSNGNVISTDTTDTTVSFWEPVAVKPEANQTVYVFNYNEKTGTTLQPLCQPLTK